MYWLVMDVLWFNIFQLESVTSKYFEEAHRLVICDVKIFLGYHKSKLFKVPITKYLKQMFRQTLWQAILR